MDRQYIFARADPPFYWAIMDEAAFRRPTCQSRELPKSSR
ncbi:hypothetical protein [Streptomyces scopuliridis]